MPYRITQCYLPPDRGDIPAFTPDEAGTRLSDPGWIQAELCWLVINIFVWLFCAPFPAAKPVFTPGHFKTLFRLYVNCKLVRLTGSMARYRSREPTQFAT